MSGIPQSLQRRPLPILPSYIYNWLWHSDFKSEKQPLQQVWLKPAYVREACLCFRSLMLGKINDIVIFEGCKESIHGSVLLVVKIENNSNNKKSQKTKMSIIENIIPKIQMWKTKEIYGSFIFLVKIRMHGEYSP